MFKQTGKSSNKRLSHASFEHNNQRTETSPLHNKNSAISEHETEMHYMEPKSVTKKSKMAAEVNMKNKNAK